VARRSVEEPSARRQLAASLQAVKRKLATTSGSAHGDDRTP
jgi:hypothetical protein